MWKVEDAMEGRVSQGKARNGDLPEHVWLYLPGKRVFQLQKLLEEMAEKGGSYFDVRMVVLLAETLRDGVALFQASGGVGPPRSVSIGDTGGYPRGA